MNDNAAEYVITCIYNAPERPEPHQIRQYLIEPIGDARSTVVMHYRMLDFLSAAIREDRAVDALNIFNLIWWDMNVSSAQYMFDLVKDMECDPDDDMGSHTVIALSHTILAKFQLT